MRKFFLTAVFFTAAGIGITAFIDEFETMGFKAVEFVASCIDNLPLASF